MNAKPKYKRLLLKVSGEALLGDQEFGIDTKMTSKIAGDIKAAVDMGCEIGVVVGGGNIFRGVALAAKGADRVTGDQMGILATTINALALRMAIEETGLECVVINAVEMPRITLTFSQTTLDEQMAAGIRRHRSPVQLCLALLLDRCKFLWITLLPRRKKSVRQTVRGYKLLFNWPQV